MLEGTIQVAGDRLRITAWLSNVDDGYQLWSESYDKNFEEVFSVQDDIAQKIATALKIELLGENKTQIITHYTYNPEAYELYTRGYFFLDKRGKSNIEKAVECFEKAIEIDPDYVLVLNWAAWALATSPDSDYRDVSRSIELARRACQITQGKDHSSLTTLAAACAANRDFVSAIQCQTKAVDLLTPDQHLGLKIKYQLLLGQYESHNPYYRQHKRSLIAHWQFDSAKRGKIKSVSRGVYQKA